jgi:hypothetical protein
VRSAFNYTTPKLGEQCRNEGVVVRDWRLGGVFRYQSGQLIRTRVSNGVMNQWRVQTRTGGRHNPHEVVLKDSP